MEITKTTTHKYEVANVALNLFVFNENFRKIRGRFKYKGFACFRCHHKFKDGEKISLLQFKNYPNRLVCHECAKACDDALKAEKKSNKLKIKNILQTCSSCPSQWEAKLDDGRMAYFRYRHGYLAVSVSKEITNDIYDAIGDTADYVYEKEIGGEYDGDMETEEMMKLTSHIFEYPEVELTSLLIQEGE
jgi:hypothetical protein